MATTADHERESPERPGTDPLADVRGMEVLSRDECVALLARGGVGRIALTMRALPVILPVGYTLLGDDVVFRADEGSRVAAAADHAVVAFEADDVDERSGGAWSVCVTGMATSLTDPEVLGELPELPRWPELPERADDTPTGLVRIRSQIVTGRRFGRPGLIAPA